MGRILDDEQPNTDELRLAAESRVICEVLAAREAKLAIAI